jgi:hypothetical protein
VEYWANEYKTSQHFGATMTMQANIALHMIEHFGSIAGKLDGEDSQGRARLGLQEPAELVERCCQIAELAMAAFEKRNWVRPETVTDAMRAARYAEISRARWERLDKKADTDLNSGTTIADGD